MRGDTGNRILNALPAGARRSFHDTLVELPAGTAVVAGSKYKGIDLAMLLEAEHAKANR